MAQDVGRLDVSVHHAHHLVQMSERLEELLARSAPLGRRCKGLSSSEARVDEALQIRRRTLVQKLDRKR